MRTNHCPFANPLPHKCSLPRDDHYYQLIVYYSSRYFLWRVYVVYYWGCTQYFDLHKWDLTIEIILHLGFLLANISVTSFLCLFTASSLFAVVT